MFRAGSRAAKIGVIVIELAGVLIAVAAAGAALLYWRLQSGPVSLSFFEASAEYAIRRSLPDGHDVDIDRATLARAPAPGQYDLRLEKIVIVDPDRQPIAELSAIDLEIFVQDLLRGAVGPRRISIDDAAFTIERRADRSIRLVSRPTREERNFFHLLTGGKRFRKTVREVELRSAQVDFHDEASGKTWSANNASAYIRRTPSGYAARLDGAFDVGGDRSTISLDADYSESAGVVTATVDVVEAPIMDLLETFYGRQALTLTGPLSGKVELKASRTGEILSSNIDGRVGAGQLKIGDRLTPIDSIELSAVFDPSANSFRIDALEYAAGQSHGVVAGVIEASPTPGEIAPAHIRFDLVGENVVIEAGDFLEQSLAVDRARVAGGYDVAARKFVAEEIEARLLDVELKGALAITAPRADGKDAPPSPAIEGAFDVVGALDPQRILRFWPLTAARGARDFVSTRLPTARVDNVHLDIDLPAGALADGQPAPDSAWSLAFDIDEATAYYSPRMTPLSRASGAARLTADRFVIDSVRGRVGRVGISDGEIDFTALSPPGEPVNFRFTADGAARDILAILDEEPLALLRKTRFEPSAFEGAARLRVEISRPNRIEVPREKYQFSGKASFEDVTVSNFLGEATLADAQGEVAFGNRSMTVKSEARLGDSPVAINWRNDFMKTGAQSVFEIEGVLDSSIGDAFSIPTRQFMTGSARYVARAVGDLSGIDELTITADFSEAALLLSAFDWNKPKGVEAEGLLDLAFDDGGVAVRELRLTGEGMSIRGDARFGSEGVINTINVDEFTLAGAADFRFGATRTESGLLDMTMTGRLFSASQMIKSVVEQGAAGKSGERFDWGAGVIVRGRLDELRARGGTVYRDVTLDLRRGRERMEALEFSARTDAGKPLSILLKESGSQGGPRQVVEARTDDIGSLLSAVFSISSLRGGEGSMQVLAGGDGGGGGLSGILEARNMRVVRAPLLARIFAAGSLNGLSDLLNGDGIALDEAFARFGFADGVVTIDDARATGPAVGITGEGDIAAGEGGAVELSGAIAPAYQVNSLLGKTPLIGDLLVNREGEGVVAFAYDVTGPSDAPTITVNPLSALAPGFLRRMFEGVDAPLTEDIPASDAADEPAPPSE